MEQDPSGPFEGAFEVHIGRLNTEGGAVYQVQFISCELDTRGDREVNLAVALSALGGSTRMTNSSSFRVQEG